MPKAQSILEVISTKLSRFNLEQLEQVAVAIKCIEAGDEAVGSKVCYLLKELEVARVSLNYYKEIEIKYRKLKREASKLRSEIKRKTKEIEAVTEEKAELETAISNLQQTILRLRKAA